VRQFKKTHRKMARKTFGRKQNSNSALYIGIGVAISVLAGVVLVNQGKPEQITKSEPEKETRIEQPKIVQAVAVKTEPPAIQSLPAKVETPDEKAAVLAATVERERQYNSERSAAPKPVYQAPVPEKSTQPIVQPKANPEPAESKKELIKAVPIVDEQTKRLVLQMINEAKVLMQSKKTIAEARIKLDEAEALAAGSVTTNLRQLLLANSLMNDGYALLENSRLSDAKDKFNAAYSILSKLPAADRGYRVPPITDEQVKNAWGMIDQGRAADARNKMANNLLPPLRTGE